MIEEELIRIGLWIWLLIFVSIDAFATYYLMKKWDSIRGRDAAIAGEQNYLARKAFRHLGYRWGAVALAAWATIIVTSITIQSELWVVGAMFGLYMHTVQMHYGQWKLMKSAWSEGIAIDRLEFLNAKEAKAYGNMETIP